MKKNDSNNPFLVLLFTFLVSSCNVTSTDSTKNEFKYPPDNHNKISITQGVWGNVWFWEGNFMPIADPNYAKITPVKRDIYIYEATPDSMVEGSNGGTFFTKINSKFINITQSDEDGFYQITLPLGKYSFFVKEDSLFYANGWDGEGYILSATVTENNITKNQIDITYKAVY